MAGRSRVFVNGFPLLIMQSISARSKGATVYQIENDIEDAAGYRPATGAVFSALGNLEQHKQVGRRLEPVEGRETYVYTLTNQGEARRRWMTDAIKKAGSKAGQRPEGRGGQHRPARRIARPKPEDPERVVCGA